MANAFLQELQWNMETKANLLNAEQVANDVVVYPVTQQETTTKYKKLIDDLLPGWTPCRKKSED